MAIESKMPRAFGKSSSSAWKWVLGVLGIGVVFGIWYLVSGILVQRTQTDLVTDATKYQAVFLDNGQVYFGHLTSGEEFFRLTDVFYLQYRQNPQTGDPAADADVSIIKLGNEVHGPQDWMDINEEHILFIEELKAESRVASAIADYNSKHTNN
jgi:hypothetical protein